MTKEDGVRKGKVEIPVVDNETYQRLKERLTNLGYAFFEIKPETVTEIMEDDNYREAEGRERRLQIDGVDSSEIMRNNRPPAVEIAVRLDVVPIERGNGKITEEHREIVEDERKKLTKLLSPDLQNLVTVTMPTHASMAVQLIEQLDHMSSARTGQHFIKDWFLRTEDQIHDGGARVGRYVTDKGVRIRGRDDRPVNDVEVVAVVILPRVAV